VRPTQNLRPGILLRPRPAHADLDMAPFSQLSGAHGHMR
jgi:hypothetical protein